LTESLNKRKGERVMSPLPIEAYQESHVANVAWGTTLGALIGGGMGWGACTFVFEETLLFTGDTILAGALLCGTLGFYLGEDFIEWLKEHWADFLG
jgi:hypothetical protein